ncbi:MAG: plastocyanin/azurin family copper-binding protein [Gaiellaceae bacterium]
MVSPAPGWAKRFPRDEKVFLVLVLASVVVMTAFSIGWVLWGSHNVPTRAEVVDQKAYAQQVNEFAKRYRADDGKVWVPPGTDAYMLAYRFGWTPELVLQEDSKYTIWISSADVLHGFSLVGQNLNLQIAPKHGFGATITPTEPGRHRIICNEYCGLDHQNMTSFLTVVTAAEMAATQETIAAGGTTSGGGGVSGAIEISADPSNALLFDVVELNADAGAVTIRMANPSALPHNVAIKGNGIDAKGEIVGSGGTSTVSANVAAGTYTFYCSVPGHEQGGMTGTLIVK